MKVLFWFLAICVGTFILGQLVGEISEDEGLKEAPKGRSSRQRIIDLYRKSKALEERLKREQEIVNKLTSNKTELDDKKADNKTNQDLGQGSHKSI